jgi:hypothetical protein
MTKKQRALAKVRQYVQMELLVKQQQQLQRLLRVQHEKQQRLLAEQWSNSIAVQPNAHGDVASSKIKVEPSGSGCFGLGFDATVDLYRGSKAPNGQDAPLEGGRVVLKREVVEGVADPNAAKFDDSLDAMMLDTLPIDVDADNGIDSSWANLF